VTLAIDRGADIVRVHDVAAMSRVIRFADAVVRKRILPTERSSHPSARPTPDAD
jgi:hypothetical protein